MSVLPREIYDNILLFTDTDTCIRMDNLYCVKKIYKPNNWTTFIRTNNLKGMKYLHSNKVGSPTIFHSELAIRRNKMELLNFFIEIGNTDENLLEYAVECGNLTAVKMLVENNIKIDEFSVTIAIEKNYFKMFIFLVSKGAPLIDSMTIACTLNRIKFVKFLISFGIEVEDFDFEEAVRGGHLELVKFLVESCGINVTPEALEEAVMSDSIKMVKYISKHNKIFNEALLVSIQYSSPNISIFLINEGTPITLNCILQAVERDSLGLIKLFIEKDKQIFLDNIDEIIDNSWSYDMINLIEFTLIDRT